MFASKRDEAIGVLRKMHNEELHNTQSWPNIIRMIKSWRMRGAGHIAHEVVKSNPLIQSIIHHR
jgi:hypothetical protein